MSEISSIRSDTAALAECALLLNDVCLSNDLCIWLNYGGLLGIIREGRLLPHNNDLELSCWYSHENKKKLHIIAYEMSMLGYECFFYESFGTLNIKKGKMVDLNVNMIWKEKHSAIRPHETANVKQHLCDIKYFLYWIMSALFATAYTNHPSKFKSLKFYIIFFSSKLRSLIGTNLSFQIFLRLKGFCIFLGGKFQSTSMPLELFSEFKEHPFYSSKMLIPSNPEAILECIYGQSWRVPKDKWSFYDNKNKLETRVLFLDKPINYNHLINK
jgi:hypothetical protein